MQVSEEEILRIADLANLKLEKEKINKYKSNLEDILEFANIVNNAPISGLDETIGANSNFNVFRKDEIKVFEDAEALLQNAPSKENNMFKIPKIM